MGTPGSPVQWELFEERLTSECCAKVWFITTVDDHCRGCDQFVDLLNWARGYKVTPGHVGTIRSRNRVHMNKPQGVHADGHMRTLSVGTPAETRLSTCRPTDRVHTKLDQTLTSREEGKVLALMAALRLGLFGRLHTL
ncbi:hypothetical protein ABVT39_018545 [Epinephelus coioides]